jgi:hypothetical protein
VIKSHTYYDLGQKLCMNEDRRRSPSDLGRRGAPPYPNRAPVGRQVARSEEDSTEALVGPN